MTLILTDESAGRHQTPSGHPERPERYSAVLSAIAGAGLAAVTAPLATREQLELVHSPAYLEMIFETLEGHDFSEGRLIQLDGDTFAGPDSLEAALRGAGAACLAVDKVMSGQACSVFSAMRPPGHHAEYGSDTQCRRHVCHDDSTFRHTLVLNHIIRYRLP